jgi:hypothetical protein
MAYIGDGYEVYIVRLLCDNTEFWNGVEINNNGTT